MEPGQEEVEPGPLVGFSTHAGGGDSAEGSYEVGLDTRGWFKGEDTGGSQEVDWDLCVCVCVTCSGFTQLRGQENLMEVRNVIFW